MDVTYTFICGLFMVSLSLYAKPFTPVQYKSTKTLPALNRSARPLNEDAHVRMDADVKGARQSNLRKKQPPKNRDKRKNCFGFKMDRISDVSGMGCKSD